MKFIETPKKTKEKHKKSHELRKFQECKNGFICNCENHTGYSVKIVSIHLIVQRRSHSLGVIKHAKLNVIPNSTIFKMCKSSVCERKTPTGREANEIVVGFVGFHFNSISFDCLFSLHILYQPRHRHTYA